MNESIGILLWLPFVLLLIVSGVLCILGDRKRDLRSGLIGLAAVLVSGGMSLFLADALSNAVGEILLEKMIPLSTDLSDVLRREILRVAVYWAAELLLFAATMLVLTILLRLLCGRIFRAWKTERNATGLLTGLLSAVVFTVILTWPLYGTAAACAPIGEAVCALLAYTQEGPVQATETVQEVKKHPMVRLYSTNEAEALYDRLFSFTVGEEQVSLSELSRLTNALTDLLPTILSGEREQRLAKVHQLENAIRGLAIERDWPYVLGQNIVKELQAMRSEMDYSDAAAAECMIKMLDTTSEQFDENCSRILEFAIYILEHELLDNPMNVDPELLKDSEIPERIGALLNATPEMEQIRKMIIAYFISESMDRPFYDAIWVLDTFSLDRVTESADMKREGVVYLKIMGFLESKSLFNTLLMHPAVNPENMTYLLAWKPGSE